MCVGCSKEPLYTWESTHKICFGWEIQINQMLWSMTLFTILICCSLKKGFSHLFTFIKVLSYTGVPARLAHFTHSASIFRNRKTQRSLVRGRGTSIGKIISGLQIRVCTRKLFFLFLNQNPSQWDGSFEHPKHMFQLMDKKIIAILRYFFCLTGPMNF